MYAFSTLEQPHTDHYAAGSFLHIAANQHQRSDHEKRFSSLE